MVIIDEFGPGGATLWAALHVDDDPADTTVLVVEACRMVDRLDRLNAAVHNGGIFDLIERADAVLEVKVDSVLAEARQQALALQRILADIAKRRADVQTEPETDGLADL